MFGAALAVGVAGCSEGGEEARAALSVAETLADRDTAGFARADSTRPLRFPADHGPHPEYRHEWWYFTGNLDGRDGRRFGFQLTFFRSALRAAPSTLDSPWATSQAFMGHFALTDAEPGRFHAFERFDRAALGLAGARAEPFRVWIGDWVAEAVPAGETPGRPSDRSGLSAPAGPLATVEPVVPGLPAIRARAAAGSVAVDLRLVPEKPVVLQGDDGLSRKGPEPGNASYYYSLTRLAAEGRVVVQGDTLPVAGLAWLDREWGTSALGPDLAGWDWFSLQLSDGSELMVYRLRRKDGGTDPFSAGTFVGPDGGVARLGAGDVAIEATGGWSSPRGGRYPSGWTLRVPSLDLRLVVAPVLAAQELDLAFRYWEGAVDVGGERAGRAVAGRGYVELTGYADVPGDDS